MNIPTIVRDLESTEKEKTQLRIDSEPRKVLITSDLYVVFTKFGYQPALDVLEKRSKREYFLFVSAKSLASSLEAMRQQNGGRFLGLEFWIRKKSDERTAPYLIEE